MKILGKYTFKNKKEIRLVFHNTKSQKKLGLPDCDNYTLEFWNKDKVTSMGLRPDEIAIIISILGAGLFKSVEGYDLKLLKGYNGLNI